ncbi:MAG: UDP-N-acetylmuramoyl-tripeptide--D-alanyl-D-alanine ligase [Pseudomonadota bacterium]
MTLREVAAATGGMVHGDADTMVHGLFTDTRKPVPGALFVALRGPNFDAHDFIPSAAREGAVAALVEHPVGDDLPQVVVADTRLALGRLAAAWRARWRGRLVALTGSNGKTTTKEMLAAILRQDGVTLATRGNLNNDIGAPLMLAELNDDQAYAVIEMGASQPGEIAYLTMLARPDVAFVNNTGRAHLEGFGGKDGVIRAKGEIYAGLSEGRLQKESEMRSAPVRTLGRGVAVINMDDEGAPLWLELNRGRPVLRFGMERGDVDVNGRWSSSERGVRLHLETPGAETCVELAVAGEHNARNALAAASAALALGLKLERVKAGLESFAGVPGRLQRKPGLRGCVLWDDSYNANPDSLRAGIRAVTAQGGETWLVLGNMGELGPDSAALHAESGRLARELGVHRLYTLGDLAAEAARAFGAGARSYTDIEALLADLREAVSPGIHILIKGSRSSRMERVTQAMEETAC